MKQKRVFYRVVPSTTFAEISCNTLNEARAELIKFGECPNGTPENKAYWAKEREKCRIVRVIEITEEVEL